jgi:cell wall-associated NlpC family hydrolase
LRAPGRLAAVSALLIGLLAAGLLGASAPRAHAGSIGAKRAQAQRVLVQLQQLDAAAQRANSRYEAANRQLRHVEQQLRVNRKALGVARGNLSRAERKLARRLVSMYTSGDQQSSLAVILGAHSLDDMISRIEAANMMSKQDVTLVHEVTGYQRQIAHHRTVLRADRDQARRLVSTRAEQRSQIAGRRASAEHLYASVKSQLQAMISQQQAAQAAAAHAARAAASAQAATPKGSFGVGQPVSSPVPPGRYSGVVGIAMQYLGVPYVWGGASPKGFDCSGLVMYVFAQVGISLPHYTVAQYNYPDSVSVPRNELQPGDLVFFAGLGHVGIYVGGGNFIHAPHTGSSVRIDSLNGGWYSSEYDGAKRILG